MLCERVEQLARDNEQLRAAISVTHNDAEPQWIALKAAARGTYTYETLRSWSQNGVIEAKKERGRWYVNADSLAAHLARLIAA